MAEAIERALLQQLGDADTIADTGEFAKSLGVDHLAVVGVMKSLDMAEMITFEVRNYQRYGTCGQPAIASNEAVCMQVWRELPVCMCSTARFTSWCVFRAPNGTCTA